jgi:XTP/dITP diphosphohydrolase
MIILATRSAGKLRELGPLFASRGIHVTSLSEAGISESRDEDSLEVFATFEANAVAKAKYFHTLSGEPTVADDSGLAVNALGGAPGVLSKRWSGRADLSNQALDDENNRLLIEKLRGARDRTANYVCAAAYVDEHSVIVGRGEAPGRIIDQPQGSGGFGYDPYFESSELGATFAMVSRQAKEAVSHRGRAFRSLLSELAEHGLPLGDKRPSGS